MKSISPIIEVKHFILENISWIPQQVSRILVHAILTVGIFQGWKMFRKYAKNVK